MKQIILCILLGIVFGLIATAQQPSAEVLRLSVEDCIELALKNNLNRQSVALNETDN